MILRGKGLIISDVHEKVEKLKRIIAMYDDVVDWFLFHADFMDRFENKGQPTTATYHMCEWLKENLSNSKFRFSWGNHDIQYAFPRADVKCGGYKPAKQKIFSSYLNADYWKYFHLLTWIGPNLSDEPLNGPREWLVSHAGLHTLTLHPIHGYDKEALADMEEITMADLAYGKVHPWLEIGQGRGGSQRVGGVDWLDWTTEFEPIEGLNQIVGHTHKQYVRVKQTAGSFNLCIDTGLRHVILVDNGKIDLQEIL